MNVALKFPMRNVSRLPIKPSLFQFILMVFLILDRSLSVDIGAKNEYHMTSMSKEDSRKRIESTYVERSST
jgi:hypothetical protein